MANRDLRDVGEPSPLGPPTETRIQAGEFAVAEVGVSGAWITVDVEHSMPVRE